MTIEFWWRQIFEILMIHKPSLESLDVPKKFGPDRFSRFDVYWIQTNKQTNRQAKFIYRWFLKSSLQNEQWRRIWKIWIWSLADQICTVTKSDRPRMNPEKILHKTTFLVQLPYKLMLTPFKNHQCKLMLTKECRAENFRMVDIRIKA